MNATDVCHKCNRVYDVQSGHECEETTPAPESEHAELLRFRAGASKLQDYIEALEKALLDAIGWFEEEYPEEAGIMRSALDPAA